MSRMQPNKIRILVLTNSQTDGWIVHNTDGLVMDERAGVGLGAGFFQREGGPGTLEPPQVEVRRPKRSGHLGTLPGERLEALSGPPRPRRARVQVFLPQSQVPLQARLGPVPYRRRRPLGY